MLSAATALLLLGTSPGLAFGLDGLDASYRYVGGEREKLGLRLAIEDGIAGLFPLIRWIARRRIWHAERPSDTIEFQVGGSRISVHRPGRDHLETSADAAVAELVSDHDERFGVTQTVIGRTIAQVIRGEDGGADVAYSFSEDGRLMTMKVEIFAARLPGRVIYQLSYQRIDATR